VIKFSRLLISVLYSKFKSNFYFVTKNLKLIMTTKSLANGQHLFSLEMAVFVTFQLLALLGRLERIVFALVVNVVEIKSRFDVVLHK